MLRTGEVPYQAIIFLSRKNPPVGPPSSRVAIQTAVSAPSAGDRSASAPPISVQDPIVLATLTMRPYSTFLIELAQPADALRVVHVQRVEPDAKPVLLEPLGRLPPLLLVPLRIFVPAARDDAAFFSVYPMTSRPGGFALALRRII